SDRRELVAMLAHDQRRLPAGHGLPIRREQAKNARDLVASRQLNRDLLVGAPEAGPVVHEPRHQDAWTTVDHRPASNRFTARLQRRGSMSVGAGAVFASVSAACAASP